MAYLQALSRLFYLQIFGSFIRESSFRPYSYSLHLLTIRPPGGTLLLAGSRQRCSAAALLGINLAKAYSPHLGHTLPYGLLALAGVAGAFSVYVALSQGNESAGSLFTHASAVIAFVILAFSFWADANLTNEDVRLASRNFYGTIAVVRANSPIGPYFFLRDRMTNHGFQFVNPNFVNEPAGSYGQDSGISKLLLSYPRPMRVGLIGLGTGTLAAFGRPGDYFRFYEINPAVVKRCQRAERLLHLPAELKGQ